ncbi:MAG: hypothetical protein ACTSO7_17955 [Candidatus Heimdallarchaeota archaeon]
MRKNKIILLVLLFFTLTGFGFTAFTQRGECVQNFETTLSYGDNWYKHFESKEMPDINSCFPWSTIVWSFTAVNAVDITIRFADYDPDNNRSGNFIMITDYEGSGEIDVCGPGGYLIFWHQDVVFQDDVTLAIKIRIINAYIQYYMILIYLGSILIPTIITVSILLVKRKKKKALQEIAQPSSFTPTTQPDSSPSDLPPPPPPSESAKLFCWKCGQPNTSQTSYCIKCGSDIHNPER